MNKSDLKVGVEVWYKDTYGTIRSGKVIKLYLDKPEYVEVQGTRDNYGRQGVKTCECFKSRDELVANILKESESRQQEICESIKGVEDLVRFMYDNEVGCAEEYTDWDARRAVAKRAKELLGIDLEEVVE